MVKFIQKNSVHFKMSKGLCENLNKEHINLLLPTEIWWLSGGGVLNRVLKLKNELHEYFQETNKQYFAK